WAVDVHCPEHDIEKMHAPIRQETAAEIPLMTPGTVKSARIERLLGCRAEPEVEIDVLGRGFIGHARRALPIVKESPDLHLSYAAECAGSYEVDDLPPVWTAALLLADLHHAVVCTGRSDHRVQLRDGVRHRLLDVDVFAGLACMHELKGVPVIGCADDHGVDVGRIEQLAIVSIKRWTDAGHFFDILGPPLEHLVVHVAQSAADHVRLAEVVHEIAESHTSGADQGHRQGLVRGPGG